MSILHTGSEKEQEYLGHGDCTHGNCANARKGLVRPESDRVRIGTPVYVEKCMAVYICLSHGDRPFSSGEANMSFIFEIGDKKILWQKPISRHGLPRLNLADRGQPTKKTHMRR